MIVINKKKTAETIKNKTKACHVSVNDICDACYVSVQAVYKWFNGSNVPTLDNLAILANICGCKIDDFIVIDNI